MVANEDEEELLRSVALQNAKSILLARQQAEEALRKQSEWLRITLSSIGDAVISTDAEGRVTFLNVVAEALTGWTQAEALGRPLPEVFHIVNEGTRQPVENPALRALREGTIVRLSNHTILIARDGTERPIDDSAAPMRDGSRGPVGAVLVFRDVTNRKRAEEEIRVAEQRTRTVLESITEGFVAVDSEWRFTYMNAKAEQMFEMRREDLLGKNLWEVFPEALDTVFEREYRRAMTDRVLTRVDAPFDRLNAWLEVNVYPVRDGGLSFYFRDVTDRRRAEATIREGEERHRLMMANVNDHAIFTLDLDGRVSDWNAGAEQVFGYGREIIGQPREILFTPEDREAGRPERELEVVRAQGRVNTDRWHLKKNGSRFFASGSLEALRTEDGELRGFVKVVRDQTEQKRADDAREQRARQLQRLADISARINTAHDVHSIVGVVTEEARNLIGARQAATCMVLTTNHPQPINVVSSASKRSSEPIPPRVDGAELYETVKEENRPVRLTQDELGHDPRWRALEKVALAIPTRNGWLAAPLVGRNGKSMGLLQLADKDEGEFTDEDEAILVQLSRLAAIAIENAKLYEELKGNDQRKDEFLAMLAHELRNPLAAIGNAVGVSTRSGQQEHIDWSMEVITRQLKHLTRLIDDLLDVSRISRGKIELRRTVLDATQILDSAAATVMPLVDERKHTFDISIERGNLWVNVDPTRLEQVVVNLLNNAAKYSENAGHIDLRALNDGGDVVITVLDRGVGIPPEKLPQMFELFAQGDRSLARSEGGLGIGLTVVKKLVEMHGGSIAAKSEGLDKGSEFTIRLPRAMRPAVPDAKASGSAESASKKARILVVDDNVDTARGMVRLLKLIGHEVATAHDGHKALEVAREFGPEYILLDIGLPGMDGYEVASRLRREEGCKDAVIVAISGYGQDDDRRRSKEAGFDHHLIKPLDHNALLSLLSAGEDSRP